MPNVETVRPDTIYLAQIAKHYPAQTPFVSVLAIRLPVHAYARLRRLSSTLRPPYRR